MRTDTDNSFFGLPGADRPAEGLPELAPYGSERGDREPTWGGEYVSDGNGVWTLDAAADTVARAREALSKAAEQREATRAGLMRDDTYRAVFCEDQEDRGAAASRDDLGMG